jgi:prolyl-tRNA synthetase
MAQRLPDIKENFSDWYLETIYQAELVDQSPVRGCMVLRPYGNAVWENIKAILDARIRATGHENAVFPLLIPQSFLTKEANHVKGFAPEVAVVTHAGGSELEEPLVVRPTSETMIHYMFARWIHSWRDLPMKINQWGSVIRWEMRTRPFLRTTEFMWQEGHTAHETAQEADDEAQMMLQEYVNLVQNYLAVPAVAGQKSEQEQFPGADKTLTFESLMPDGKALQMGTSHRISQNFAQAFNITYQDRDGNVSYPHLTSWGLTTRVIGAMIMTHGDAKGLVMPPKIAPTQVVIIPILKVGANNDVILAMAQQICNELTQHGIRVVLDADDTKSPGVKFYKWELKGIPVRIEIGPRDFEQRQVVVVDRLGLEKMAIAIEQIEKHLVALLERIQSELLERATLRLKENWHHAKQLTDFAPRLAEQGGFYQVGWCRDSACEHALKEHQATIRCLVSEHTQKTCFHCGKASLGDILVAKSY